MMDSQLQTLSVPVIGGSGSQPARLTQAGKSPTRTLVRNVGGTLVMLAHDVGQLSDINSLGGTYSLPAGAEDVFVLAPGQSIFAAAAGGGGQVSVAVSEAFPVTRYMES